MKKNSIILFIISCSFLTNSILKAGEYKLTKSDTFMYFGKQLYKSQDLISATNQLDSCLMLNPKNDECWFYRAKIAYDTKDFELGKKMFKNVIALAERDAVAWNMLGLCFQETKVYDSAEFCFKNAVVINSKESRFYANWGKNEYLRGNFDHAEDLYNTAILIDPMHAKHYQNRAEVLTKLGKKENAIADLEAAAKIEPENTEIKAKLSQVNGLPINFNLLFGGLFVLILAGLIWWKLKK